MLYTMEPRKKAERILDILEGEMPEASTELRFSTPLELLVATILSAQCTDERVNRVTASLFRRYSSAADYAAEEPERLAEAISSINFYRNKAASIRRCCEKLVREHGGRVPDSLEELIRLPGVGRKTANIVLGNAFGRDALAVDTHVKRVARRLGLTKSERPDDIERDLCALIPKRRWTKATHLLILHGRRTCKARSPQCARCAVSSLCDYHRTGRRQET
ncbi:MAG TPA: endonuclease III [Deltaproteobacteria bacterium]|nr:endonuclease III [Deltaproteobacteria bacterium]